MAIDDTTAPALPPAEEWWPELPIDAKHTLLDALGEPLTDQVLDEIARITGERPDGHPLLTEKDRQYIRTQTEQVD
jgi:hypothetical protein